MSHMIVHGVIPHDVVESGFTFGTFMVGLSIIDYQKVKEH
jgi:hypothetical protein